MSFPLARPTAAPLDPPSELLAVSNLSVRIGPEPGAVRAVEGLDLGIRRSETVALVGESGCGKSMTALAIMRLLPPSARVVSGRAEFLGEDLFAFAETRMRELRGARISMIFQEPQTSLNPVMPVGLQIAETLVQHAGLKGPALRRRVLALLDAVGIPDRVRRYDEYPHQLSGGMKQRMMIAMAIACAPDLLIADEPSTALDVTIQAQILTLLKAIQSEHGMAILLITHDLGVVADFADRIAVMYAGHVVETGRRHEFFQAPAHPYSRQLFAAVPSGARRGALLAVIRGSVPPLTQDFPGCRYASRCDAVLPHCYGQPPGWGALAEGHAVRCHLYGVGLADALPRPAAFEPPPTPQAPPSAPEQTLLAVEDLRVYFPIRGGLWRRVIGQVRAVDGVSLRIASRRTLALVGESGCGKTTAGKGILRLLPVSGGHVRFDGEDLALLAPEDLRRRRAEAQFIFQDPYSSMNPRMTVAEIVAEGLRAQGLGDNEQARQRRVDALLEEVGLSAAVKQRYPHEFSGGQRQRICIARALALRPKLIVCDEPTSALDVSVQAQILNLLSGLQARLGIAYLFITHNLAVVEYLAHEVAVMYLGRIVEAGPVAEVLNNSKHPYTEALLSAVPQIDETLRRPIIRLPGVLPSPAAPPTGCHFHPRCAKAMPQCRTAYPASARFSPNHSAHCFLHTDQSRSPAAP